MFLIFQKVGFGANFWPELWLTASTGNVKFVTPEEFFGLVIHSIFVAFAR
jgi:hypothetical protein